MASKLTIKWRRASKTYTRLATRVQPVGNGRNIGFRCDCGPRRDKWAIIRLGPCGIRLLVQTRFSSTFASKCSLISHGSLASSALCSAIMTPEVWEITTSFCSDALPVLYQDLSLN